MNRIVVVVGVFLILVGSYQAEGVVDFQRRAVEVQGIVTAVEHLPGPPKPRQRTPLHVLYNLSDGREFRAVTHLPLMQEIKEGDAIRLVVDPSDPQDVRLPLISELWARPLTYLVGGLLMLITAWVLRRNRVRTKLDS